MKNEFMFYYVQNKEESIISHYFPNGRCPDSINLGPKFLNIGLYQNDYIDAEEWCKLVWWCYSEIANQSKFIFIKEIFYYGFGSSLLEEIENRKLKQQLK